MNQPVVSLRGGRQWETTSLSSQENLQCEDADKVWEQIKGILIKSHKEEIPESRMKAKKAWKTQEHLDIMDESRKNKEWNLTV